MTTWDPTLGPRTRYAWAAIVKLLADGNGQSWAALQEVARKHSDLQANSCRSLLSDAIRHGYLEHRAGSRDYYLPMEPTP